MSVISNQRAKTIFMDWLGYMINAGLAIAYIIIKSVGAKPTDASIGEILLAGALYFIVSTAMRTSMLNTGIHKGYASEQWRATATEHENRIQMCLPYSDRMQTFLDYEYRRRLKVQRIMRLRGVAYDKVFSDDGSILDYTHPYPTNLEKLNERQRKECLAKYKAECRSIKKAQRVSVPLYRSDQLFTRSNSNKRKFTVSTKKTATEIVAGGLIISVGLTVVNSLFRPDGFNWIEFFMGLGMALIAIMFSFIALYQGYTLITQSLRDDTIDKIHYLDEFQQWAIKNNEIKGNPENGQNAENNQISA